MKGTEIGREMKEADGGTEKKFCGVARAGFGFCLLCVFFLVIFLDVKTFHSPRTVHNVSAPWCCVMQSSTVSHSLLLVIESRSSPDVTLDDYRLINYCVSSLPLMTVADVSIGISPHPARNLHLCHVLNKRHANK